MRFIVEHQWGDDDWRVEYDDYDLYEMYKENTCDHDGHYIIYADHPDRAKKIAQDMYYEEKTKKSGIS
jgi:hypothetical protein